MTVANGVAILDLKVQLANGPGIIHPTVIWDENNTILVDAALPDQVSTLREEFGKAGLSFNGINKIIITHSDMDHIGGLSSILNELPKRAEVFAHKEEIPYIECDIPPIRLSQIEASLESLQGEQYSMMKALYENLRANYKSLKASVDRAVEDGEELPFCGGIEVIHTPGHTNGHICLLIKDRKILVGGDVFTIENGQLVPSIDFATLDKDAARNSLRKLTRYDIETVICYHGGVCSTDVNKRIAEIAEI